VRFGRTNACQPRSQRIGITGKAKCGNTLSHREIAQARSLADLADEKYFTLKDEGAGHDTWYSWFCKARLLSGIAIGFGEDTSSSTTQALYELICSQEDPANMVSCVRSEIGETS
jgi:hypothetical protein